MPTNGSNKLKLLQNQSKKEIKSLDEELYPPPPRRSIVVSDVKSAKKLLSKLITQQQKNEIPSYRAKDLVYSISQFLTADKLSLDFKYIEDAFRIQFLKQMEYLNESWNQLTSKIADEIGEEEYSKIFNKYLNAIKNIESRLEKRIGETIESFRKDQKFPNEILDKNIGYDEIKVLIQIKFRKLSYDQQLDLLEILGKIYQGEL